MQSVLVKEASNVHDIRHVIIEQKSLGRRSILFSQASMRLSVEAALLRRRRYSRVQAVWLHVIIHEQPFRELMVGANISAESRP